MPPIDGTTSAPWPAAGSENLPWRSVMPDDLLSDELRAQMLEPYQATVPAPVADLDLTLPAQTAELADEATAEMGRFAREMHQAVGPVGSIMLRAEAAASSQIENISSDAVQVALGELGHPEARTSALQVVGALEATRLASRLLSDLDEGTANAVHQALLGRTEPAIAGRWRTEQIWIGGGRFSPHGARFVPPRPDLIQQGIDDLALFVRRDDWAPIPFAAIAHAQFQTVHPFVDGNGRAGRAMLHSIWRSARVTPEVIVPISSGLLGARDDYFAALAAYAAGDPAPIVEALSWAVFDSISNARELVAEISATHRQWASRLTGDVHSLVWPMIDLISRQPVLDLPAVQRQLSVSKEEALATLAELVDAGALTGPHPRRGSALWLSPDLLGAMDAFAARAGLRHVGDNRRHSQRQTRRL